MTRIIGLLYIIALVVCVVCVPLSAIFIICNCVPRPPFRG